MMKQNRYEECNMHTRCSCSHEHNCTSNEKSCMNENECKKEMNGCRNSMPNACRCRKTTTGSERDKCERSPLAMAYIPDQEFRDLYPLSEALCKGTLFSELYMPFHGCFRI